MTSCFPSRKDGGRERDGAPQRVENKVFIVTGLISFFIFSEFSLFEFVGTAVTGFLPHFRGLCKITFCIPSQKKEPDGKEEPHILDILGSVMVTGCL